MMLLFKSNKLLASSDDTLNVWHLVQPASPSNATTRWIHFLFQCPHPIHWTHMGCAWEEWCSRTSSAVWQFRKEWAADVAGRECWKGQSFWAKKCTSNDMLQFILTSLILMYSAGFSKGSERTPIKQIHPVSTVPSSKTPWGFSLGFTSVHF